MDCSFCKKFHAEVRKLIAGPEARICDECVLECLKVLLYPNAELERLDRRLSAEYGRIHQ